MSEARVTESADIESIGANPTEGNDIGAPIESDTPGSVLRRTREARGQSIADVVQVIRFSSRQIEALERDDYASLPGSTAVRGLVRNYAKFLRLDAAPLLAQLDPAVPVPEADVRPPVNMGEAEQPSVFERVPPKFIAAAIAILLSTLAAYWYSDLSADGVLTQRLPGMADSPSVVSPNPVAAAAVVPVVAPAPAVIAEAQPAGPGVTSGQIPFAGLRVEFDDRSWIEIRDATQKVVFDGVYPAGTRQNVEGKPPFQVWIGKASGVRLFMGERSIDLKPHTRAEVARFSLE
ncbi:MAG: helix-turn-helix domain-containing protein [Rhodocyclaceae bacterium]|nr:MAG: helix-turn-helix domain-containing protein [Rhodocyclaceae bacterium]